MSQVVVCEDHLSAKRKKSLEQEKKIKRDDGLSSWQRSDATRTLLIERLLVLVFAPLILFWTLIMSCIGAAFAVVLTVFKALGRLLSLLPGTGKADQPSS